ncbi:MAG: nucleoside triphosphate pyrophosphohydrolase [Candidatus Sericytochromatia bacterium]
MGITVIGMGPGDPNHLTYEAYKALEAAPEIYLRTRVHPTVALFEEWGKTLHSFDHLYETESSFDKLYERIVGELVEKGKQGEVIYAVPGHPLVAEATVRHLIAQDTVPVKLMAGLSGVEATYALLGVDPVAGLQIVDALQLDSLQLNPELGALVLQVYSRRVAQQAKMALMRFYPDEHPVTLVRAASVPGAEFKETIPLYEIDRRTDVDHLTSLYVPPAPPVGVERLRQIVARLRGPGGCPWDIEQTHESLRKFILEEAYEAVEAIDEGDDDMMIEEFGDLLLQVVLQSQVAEDREAFDLKDVAEAISDKLVFRHPHVFGDVSVEDSAEVLRNWDQLKAQEKEMAGDEGESRLGKVPPMAALAYAEKTMGRAAKAGFDWPTEPEAIAKIEEEWAELKEALAADDAEAIFHEFGDFLYALVNVARRRKLDPEDALRQAVRRFTARFHAMESIAEERGEAWEGLSLESRKALWHEAKEALAAGLE